ncbi:MAG: hypothetical protein LR015_10300 [Verrucomicrobia bacterium]|nr:hypothetical protein [Verrucomicrobiota bacterium]
MKQLWAFILVSIPIISLSSLHADEAADALLAKMGPEVYHASGMHRLSPEERAALATWMGAMVEIERERAKDEALPSGEPSFGLEHVTERIGSLFRNSPDRIESRIIGEFRGWNGNTVFRLENGQVWRQSAPGTFFYRTENPVVYIRRAMLGSYLLQIEGKNSSVRVRRIE